MPYFTMPKRSPNPKVRNLRKQMSHLQSQISVMKKTNKRPQKRVSIPRQPRILADEARYRLALVNPFHPQARGCKCTVFPYSNTQTQTIAWRGIITLDTNAVPGTLILQANPCFYGFLGGTGSTARNFQTVLGPVVQQGFASNYGLNGALLDSLASANGIPLLSQQLMNYRVVAGGVKIRSVYQTNSSQVTGSMIPILTQNSDLPYATLTGNGGDGGPLTALSVPSTSSVNVGFWGLNPSSGVLGEGQAFVEKSIFGQPMTTNGSILTFPEVRNFSTYDILQKPLMTRFLPISPEAFEFRDLGSANMAFSPTSGQTNTFGDLVVVQSGNTNATSTTRRGNTDSAGFTGLYLTYVNGGSVSNPPSGAAVFEIEYILHVEGTPAYGTNFGAFTGPCPKASSESSIITFARNLPTIMRVAEDGINLISDIASGVSSLRTMLGQSTRYPRIEL